MNDMIKVLFVEDDPNLGLLLKENLVNKGYDVVWCKDGSSGAEMFASQKFSLCIFDVMLPNTDGFELAKQVRNMDEHVPIIFLTARSMHEDKMKGFEIGCDDYITKPFSTQELCMRMNAILKRVQSKPVTKAKVLSLGKFTFDYSKMLLQLADESTKLSSKESELLYILGINKNELVPRNTILEKVWGNDDYFSAKSMDVYISKIRKMLKGDADIEILNAYGIGFKLIINE